MKYEINGQVIETDKELSEAEIDEIGQQIGGGVSNSSANMEAPAQDVSTQAIPAPQPSMKDKLIGMAKKAAPMVGKAMSALEPALPGIGTMAGGLNALGISQTIGQPAQKLVAEPVQQALETRGVNPALSMIGGQVAAAPFDPNTYMMGPIIKGSGRLVEKGAELAAKEAMVGIQALSGVKPNAIKALFNSPIETLTAMTQKKSGAMYQAAKKSFGITNAEEKLIAKAGDRTPGVARSVAEELAPKIEAGTATIGELVAIRRAALKVAQNSKGSEKYLYGQDAEKYTKLLGNQAKPILDAIREVAKSKNRGEFLRLFSRQKGNSGHGDFFKTIGNIGTAGLTSPLTVGAATLAAKGATVVAGPPVKAAAKVGGRVLPPALLRAIEAERAKRK